MESFSIKVQILGDSALVTSSPLTAASMTSVLPPETTVITRPVQYRDLEAVEHLFAKGLDPDCYSRSVGSGRSLQRVRRWYNPLRLLGLFPADWFHHLFRTYVAEQDSQVRGVVQISPFNCSGTTWRVDRVAVDPLASAQGIGSHLLRSCFETILEARTWLLEVNVNNTETLSLYRQTGFQPLAQMTYWAIAAEQLQDLAGREPDLPNLLPVSNADATLLYQLDTAAMPPLVRQVFDRRDRDFKTGLLQSLIEGVQQQLSHTEVVSGYVFEPQRKAAIGYFRVRLYQDGTQPHVAQLTVHPAYTWLYPELLTQMARLTQNFPAQVLRLASSDFQPEREEYLEQVGAERVEHTLLMSRSVFHKLRESKPVFLEGLQLSDVLQGFQPNRKPVPGRISLLDPGQQQRHQDNSPSALESGINGLEFK